MKIVRVIVMGAVGVAVAAALSWGSFAIAGGSINEPARPVSVPSGRESNLGPSVSGSPAEPTTSPEPGDDPGGASEQPTQTSIPTASPSDDSRQESSGAEPSPNDHDEDD